MIMKHLSLSYTKSEEKQMVTKTMRSCLSLLAFSLRTIYQPDGELVDRSFCTTLSYFFTTDGLSCWCKIKLKN